MGLKIKPSSWPQNRLIPGPYNRPFGAFKWTLLWCIKLDLPFCKLMPGRTGGLENHTRSLPASKSTQSGALKVTFQGLQMDPSLVPKNRPSGAFKWTLLWYLKIDLPFQQIDTQAYGWA